LTRMNLVAPLLRLGNLPNDDQALMQLRSDLAREVGFPEAFTDQIVRSLTGVDHLGSLLRVDAAVSDAIQEYERMADAGRQQMLVFDGATNPRGKVYIDFIENAVVFSEAKHTVIDHLE